MCRLITLEFLILTTCVLARYVNCYKDVEIVSGVVRGYLAEDGDYLAYLGIPYAAPPIGNRRFKVKYFILATLFGSWNS